MREIIKWDLLQPADIEVRVATVRNNKAVMLLYQDSRCTARALDRQFGSFGWQIEYKVIGEQIYGTLSIWDENKQQWISKSDTGDKSNISEDKGQSSDILKRCAVRWGFATELYTAPKIEIPDDGYGNTGYKVSEIDYNEYREITHLVIVNRFGKEAYRWDMGTVVPQQQKKPLIIENNHTDELEWSPEDNRQPVAMVQMTKQLTPAEELTQWYQTITDAAPQTQRFYKYYLNKINTGQWKGAMDINRLYNNWMSRAA